MSDDCKDFFVAIAVLAILSILVSFYGAPFEIEPTNGNWKMPRSGTYRKGDSGVVIPGKGTDPVEVVLPEDVEREETEADEATEAASEEFRPKVIRETKTTSEETSEEIKEEHNKMDGMIIAFWHGVAAVLIGEASALMVAFVWMKIRGGK